MKQPPLRLVEVDGIDMAYRELGEGRPVLALPPGPGLDSSVFFPWLSALARQHRTIAIDYRGHGGSGSGGRETWTAARLADDIESFVGVLRLDRYALLGHSFGGRLAMYLAARRPPGLAGLIVSCSLAHSGVFERADARLEELPPHIRDPVVRSFEAEDAGLIRTADEARQMWADQMPFFLAEPDGRALREIVGAWAGARYSPEIAEALGTAELRDLRPVLPSIRCPTLVVAGGYDRVTDVAAAEEIAALIDDARVVVIDAAGHFPYAERPAVYFETVGAFLRAI